MATVGGGLGGSKLSLLNVCVCLLIVHNGIPLVVAEFLHIKSIQFIQCNRATYIKNSGTFPVGAFIPARHRHVYFDWVYSSTTVVNIPEFFCRVNRGKTNHFLLYWFSPPFKKGYNEKNYIGLKFIILSIK
eukprot:sb/3475055/